MMPHTSSGRVLVVIICALALSACSWRHTIYAPWTAVDYQRQQQMGVTWYVRCVVVKTFTPKVVFEQSTGAPTTATCKVTYSQREGKIATEDTVILEGISADIRPGAVIYIHLAESDGSFANMTDENGKELHRMLPAWSPIEFEK